MPTAFPSGTAHTHNTHPPSSPCSALSANQTVTCGWEGQGPKTQVAAGPHVPAAPSVHPPAAAAPILRSADPTSPPATSFANDPDPRLPVPRGEGRALTGQPPRLPASVPCHWAACPVHLAAPADNNSRSCQLSFELLVTQVACLTSRFPDTKYRQDKEFGPLARQRQGMVSTQCAPRLAHPLCINNSSQGWQHESTGR